MKHEELQQYYAEAQPMPMDEATIERLRPLFVTDWKHWEWNENAEVTREQAAEDIDCFFDLLRFCYAGYEYYADKVDFAGLKEQILSSLPERMSAMDVKNAFYLPLKPYINDTHFYFRTKDESSFEKAYHAYFTGITVAETVEGYTVLEDETGIFSSGYIFTAENIKEYLFETLPAPDGTRRYLIGMLSPEKVESIQLDGVSCPVHHCRTDAAETGEEQMLETERDGIPVVYHTNYCVDPNTENPFEPFRKSGETYRESAVLVWSVLNNYGGSTYYPAHFVRGLNDHAVWEVSGSVLENPLLDEEVKEPLKTYRTFLGGEKIDHSKATYNGKLFVLQNKGVASSGEGAVKFAQSVKNVCFVGSATAGCGQFGENRGYRLPNSGVTFHMGYKVFNMDGFEEGKGIAPDYWLDTTDPVGAVVEYIKTLK
ncbi:MAG: hypothetical protein J6I42_11655 [Clostridia bacterium]|nr:hypothetical protein [Clostridia bacterium]